MTNPETAPEQTPPARTSQGGFFKEWVLPIVVGLAIGAGIVWVWPTVSRSVAQVFDSAVWKVVDRWDPDGWDENDKLTEEIRGLGKEARADVLRAFRRVDVPPDFWQGEDEKKVWVGRTLAGEPFFDSRSLVEIASDPDAPVWDRRCAAAALVHTLRKDVNPTVATEPLLAWLDDLTLIDHGIAMTSVGVMSQEKVFPPDQEDRLRRALLRLVERDARKPPEEPEDQVRLSNDRAHAIQMLAGTWSNADVKAAVWKVALDEADDVRTRAAAVQVVSQSGDFDLAKWKQLAASADPIVRQTVADNLARTQDPAFDEVLVPLHEDAAQWTRIGSIDTQMQRGRPTMLPLAGELVEDASPWVRRQTLLAFARFKSRTDGLGARQGMALRLLESSDADEDIEGAILSLHGMTGECFGFEPSDVDLKAEHVSETALATFKADKEGRRIAVEKWRKKLGSTAVWTDAERKAALEKLLEHADPENQARAKAELAKLPQ